MAVLHEGYAYWLGVTIDPNADGKAAPQPSRIKATPEALQQWLADNSGKLNCYLYPACIKLGAGLKHKYPKEDIEATHALWVDIDPEGGERFWPSRDERLAALRAYALPPSCIVDSGNGFQAYWFLKEPASEQEQVERRNKHLADVLNGDRCHSIDHLMRLPDAVNVLTTKKLEEKQYAPGNRTARIVDWNPERRYSLSEFEAAAPQAVAATADKPAIKINWSEVPHQDLSWLDNLPLTFPRKGELILNHSGALKDLNELLEEEGLQGEKPYGSWSDVTHALAAVLKGTDLSHDMMAAVLCAKRPCNQHVTKEPKESVRRRKVERSLTRSHEPSSGNEDGPWPDGCSELGIPFKGYANTLMAITRLGIECYYDVFRGKEFVHGHDIRDLTGEISDAGVTMLRHNIRKRFKFYPEKTVTQEAITVACRSNMRNPVLDYFDSLPRHDLSKGTPLLDKMFHRYLGAPDTPLNAAFGRKFMCAIVRRAKQPGCKWDHEPMLKGKQELGKSMFCEDLAVEPDLYTDASVLTGTQKEQMEVMGGKQIIEIAEMAGFSQTTRERNKAFRTRKVDRARMAYDRYASDQPRSSVTISTANEGVLNDPTGERRYWPVEVTKLHDHEAFMRDKDALYAEAIAAEPHENLWLDTPELKAAHAEMVQQVKAPNDLVDLLSNLEGVVFGSEERISNSGVRAHLGLNSPDAVKDMRLASRIADAMLANGWEKVPTPMHCSHIGLPAQRGFRRMLDPKKISERKQRDDAYSTDAKVQPVLPLET